MQRKPTSEPHWCYVPPAATCCIGSMAFIDSLVYQTVLINGKVRARNEGLTLHLFQDLFCSEQ